MDAPVLRDSRQLQYPCTLPFRQYIQENRASVRKREGVVMLFRRARLNLAKSSNLKARALGRQPITIVSDLVLEREFGAGKQAYRDTRLFLRGKAARRRAVETGCNQRIANFGWTRCNSMQAIIAHGFSPLISAPGRLIG